MTISGGITRFTNNATTDLNGGINAVVTSLVVDSALGFPNPGPFRILIDSEQLQVTGGYGTTTWTVIRAVDGTAAAIHADEAVVTHNITAFDYNSFRAEFNPIAFGAKGDGTTDDSVPFQNAINDAHALINGGHIFLPDLAFKVVSNLTTYANVIFVTYGAVISGAGAASVTPLIRWSQLGALSLPAALTVQSGGANITGGLTVASGNFSTTGTTTFNTKAYTWPATYGSNGQALTSDGAGVLSWATAAGAPVTSVSGTANQVTVSPTTGAPVVSLPSGGTLPGSWTAASGFTVTTGGMIISAGGLVVSASGANITGGITGTIATAAQPNITSLGTLSSVAVSGTTTLNTVALTWPSTAGSNGQALLTNGAGTLSWGNVTSAVTSVSGTSNQVTVSPTTGPVVVSLPSSGTLPGSWTAATGFTVTTGGLVISGGGINVSGGITGTLSTAAQPNITSLGTLSSVTVSGTTTFNTRALTWPAGTGSNGQALTTNGSGTLSWTTITSSVTSVSGTANQVTVSPTSGATVVSLVSGGTLPGAWTASSLFTASAGINLSDNANNTVPTIPSANGTQIWIQSSDPGGSAGEGDVWIEG